MQLGVNMMHSQLYQVLFHHVLNTFLSSEFIFFLIVLYSPRPPAEPASDLVLFIIFFWKKKKKKYWVNITNRLGSMVALRGNSNVKKKKKD